MFLLLPRCRTICVVASVSDTEYPSKERCQLSYRMHDAMLDCTPRTTVRCSNGDHIMKIGSSDSVAWAARCPSACASTVSHRGLGCSCRRETRRWRTTDCGSRQIPARWPRTAPKSSSRSSPRITACAAFSPVSDGFLAGDVNGKLFIEMSTLQPMTARELAPLVEAKGARLIDSPVLGTIPQVQGRQAVRAVRRTRRRPRRARGRCWRS